MVDLDPEPSPRLGGDGGQGRNMPPEEAGAHRGETYDMSRLRSSSLEIKEKGTEFLREQLDAAQKVPHVLFYTLKIMFLAGLYIYLRIIFQCKRFRSVFGIVTLQNMVSSYK